MENYKDLASVLYAHYVTGNEYPMCNMGKMVNFLH